MNEIKYHNVCLILGTEFVKYSISENQIENRYSIIVKSSMSSDIFQKLIQEGVHFFYDGLSLILI